MTRSLFLIAAVALVLAGNAQTNVSGTIASNTTWTTTGSPYTVTAQLTINAGVTLTIDPGVQVLMNSTSIQVNGTLDADDVDFAANGSPNGWNISVNNGGLATLTDCSMANGNQIGVSVGGTATLSGTGLTNLAINSGGTINMTGGAVTKPGSTAVTISGSATFNGTSISNSTTAVAVNAGTASFTGVIVGASTNAYTLSAGTTTIQSLTISGTTYPFTFNGPAALVNNGGHSISGNTFNVARTAFNTLSTNWTMPSLPIPWYMESSSTFTVNSGITWTIASNNIIKLGDSKQLAINGKVVANAAAGESIVFTSFRDDNQGGDSNGNGSGNAPSVGIWQGLRFSNLADPTSSLTRCTFFFAGESTTRGAVDVNTIAPSIVGCTFQLNRFGITLRNGSQALIQDCTIGSSTSTPIAMTLDCNPQFVNNTFSFIDNQYDAIGILTTTLTADNTLVQRNVTGINNVTYVLLGTIEIPAGRTLNIVPGIVIKATSSRDLMVAGTLNMLGTAGEPITFTSIADDNVGNPNDTNKDGNLSLPTTAANRPGGIGINTGATVALEHVNLRFCSSSTTVFGVGSWSPFINSWMVFDLGGSVSLQNCLLSDGTYGYQGSETSAAVFTNVTFQNLSQAPISIQAPANPSFTNVAFTNVGLRALGILGGTITVNGSLQQRTLAGFTNITQVLLGNLTVAAGTYLEVQPGVVLKVGQSASSIEVNGGFRLFGTAGQPVVITDWRDDAYGNPADTNEDGGNTSPNPGNWVGIRYNAAADDAYNSVQHTIIRFAGQGSCDAGARGAVTYVNAGGTMNNSTISSGMFGLVFIGNSDPAISTISIDNCRIDAFAQSWEATPALNNISLGNQNGSNGIRLLNATITSDLTIGPGFINGVGPVSYLSSELTVATGATLTILPGTNFKWGSQNYPNWSSCGSSCVYWTINGALVAVGTSGQPIVFTSFKDDSVDGDTNNDGNSSTPQATDGTRIVFTSTSNAALNQLRHCQLRYSSYGCGGDDDHGVIQFHSSGGMVQDCIIDLTQYAAFHFRGSANPTVQNNFINNVLSDAPVLMSAFANPTLLNNTISNVSTFAIRLRRETWSTSGTIPLRALGGYYPIPYVVNQSFFGSSFEITNNAVITIQPGTVFKSGGYTMFRVQNGGRLMVEGTASEPVVFTSINDDSEGSLGDTNQDGNATSPSILGANGHITFEGTSDDLSRIEHARFKFMEKPIVSINARPRIRNSSFQSCTYGIEARGTEGPFMPYNTFHDLSQTPVLTSILSIPDSLMGNVMTGTTKKMLQLDSETLLQDRTLHKLDFGDVSNIPYYIDGTFTVGTNANLSIAPGVRMKFGSGGRLVVNRGLLALGGPTPDSLIVFTHEADDFYGGDSNSNGPGAVPSGGWQGITFENAAVDPSCLLDHCVIRYANSSTYGGVRCNSASPTITNTRFQFCHSGVRAEGVSNPLVNWCDFQSLTTQGVNNVSQNFNINAENCYWGHPSGPTHSGNPGGTGVSVTNQVDYLPFQTGPNAPLMGDVSLNGTVTAFDASLVLQSTVNLITLSPQQELVAEVSGNGTVTAFDASLILQYTVGLIDNFPVTQNIGGGGGGGMQQMKLLTEPATLLLPSVQVAPGDTFFVDVLLGDVASLLSLEATLGYDAGLLELLEVEPLLPLSFSALHATPSPGILMLSAASAFPLTSDAAAFRLHFVANATVTESTASLLDPLVVILDEQDATAQALAGEVLITPGITTSIIDASSLPPLGIYPNPSTDGFTVVWSGATAGEAVELQLFDNAGRMVYALRTMPAQGSRGVELRVERGALGGVSGLLFVRLAQGANVVWDRVVLQ